MMVLRIQRNSTIRIPGGSAKLIDTERVSDSFTTTSSQNEKNSKPDAMRCIIMLLPVEYDLPESFVKLRKISSNVDYVKSRLL